MPIHFYGDTSIDNYEFHGEFKPLLFEYGGWQGSSKIAIHRLGGVHLLARFTAYAWSLLYGPKKSREGPIKDLKPATTFVEKVLTSRETQLYRNPREFDNYWQFSYQLDKCGNEYRVPRHRQAGVTPPTDTEKPPHVVGKEDELCLDIPGETKLFVINYRKAYAPETAEHKRFYNHIQERHQQLAQSVIAEDDAWTIIKLRDAPTRDDDVGFFSALAAQNSERTVAVVPADEFRKLGMPISRSLSWERTLRDIIRLIRVGELLPRNMPSHIIITFDYDAALYLKTRSKGQNTAECAVDKGLLVFSVGRAEGDFESGVEGDMPGAQTIFVSMLSTLLYRELTAGLTAATPSADPLARIGMILECSLIAKRRFLQSGFAILDEEARPFSVPGKTAESGLNNRLISRILYSEGIFSLLQKRRPRGDRSSEPPDPLFDSEAVKRRAFLDPFDNPEDLQSTLSDQKLATYIFQDGDIPDDRGPVNWSIFTRVNDRKKAELKRKKKDSPSKEGTSDPAKYVIKGDMPKDVPICSFGKITTVDVREIEDFRTIANLLQSYLSNPSQTRPLGIAVFGPAGAGKSFAIKNIVETLPPDAKKTLVRDDRLDCNLTALGGPEDLAQYFQVARNNVLRGKVPMLFFDEFDCTVDNSRFFWLKHFLAPLQDGEYRSGQIVNPIGRAIFVFAGSVFDDFEQFCRAMDENKQSAEQSPKAPAKEPSTQHEASFKGVDFLSRLHGHIDITDFTPKAPKFFYRHKGDDEAILIDPSYLMRRAFVLRSLLEQYYHSQIFSHGSPPEARIDAKIVNALLATRTFRHGVRSMESILRMSYLEGGHRFEISHLPPNRQLQMHVDVKNFDYCLGRDIDQIWRESAIRPESRQPGRRPPKPGRRGRAGGRGRR